MNKQEKLQRVETSTFDHNEQIEITARLDFEQVEQVFSSRKNTLSRIEKYISPHLQSILRVKINNERKNLLEIMEKGEVIEPKVEKNTKVLDERYFTQKHLDPNLF